MAGSTWDAAAGRPAVPHRFGGQPGPLGCGDCCGTEDQIARPSPSGASGSPDKAYQACGRLLRVAAASPPMGRTRSRPSSRPPCTPSRQGMTQWSCRLMAGSQGMSKSTISNIWRSHNLKPHRVKTFKLSRDPQFPGETQRCRRSLSQSPAGSDCAVRGREEPNSSPRSDPAWFALKEGTLRHDDP